MEDKKSYFPSTPVYILFIVMMVILVILLLWATIVTANLNSIFSSLSENPFCARISCQGEKEIQAYRLDPIDDPQQNMFQTTNWCISNSPPIEFQGYVTDICPNTPQTQNEENLLGDFITFYPSYLKTCGYAWITENNVLTNENFGDQNTVKDPNWTNSRFGLNGTHNNFLSDVLVCVKSPTVSDDFRTRYKAQIDVLEQCERGSCPT